jgi:hypothetical protein
MLPNALPLLAGVSVLQYINGALLVPYYWLWPATLAC